ncbi:marine proteobacterial sortase target protein [Flavisphingomonas formosensis]|uniref:marine proteobacterial sortase target protein n=1 Tax=Flavisphingomonas formosensis TaxID=861534 RepID=UPI001E481D93|nr:marine proteobacterial sortase target protein [Sphingomonas formosensis]
MFLPFPLPTRSAAFGVIPAAALLAAVPAVTVMPARAPAASPAAADATAADDGPTNGTLLLRRPGVADALPAIRLGTDMDVTVTGPVARVRVTQAFRNTSGQWMEARYLYPLPEGGAVDGLRMVVGQRVIVGRIHERAQARQIYDQAKAEGRKAGLVEQQRPNMFTTNVANVGPGETVLISIDYQMPVRAAQGTYSLRLPLVIGPRYVPPHSLTSAPAAADADTVTSSPILDPKLRQNLNPVSIAVHLAPGFAPANVISRYHHVRIAGHGDRREIRLASGDVPADRDFELSWRSASADPTIGLFRERSNGQDYVMAAITPPVDDVKRAVPPREMVFVIDNSGSMGGSSMEEAKASLLHALAALRPQDRFNVIRFDDTMTRLFDHSVAATPDQVAVAERFAKGLQADGGTEMLPALKAALADAAVSGTPDMVRQVIFLTDGAISNEQEMLATLGQDGGRSHVFLIGIGSAPNDHLMARMAEIGRGTYTHISTPEEVSARMAALLDTLERPSVRNLSVKVEGMAIDLTPRMLPDLYAGEPLVLLGRTGAVQGTMTISGRIGDRPWSQTVRLADAVPSPAVAKLWARRRIDDVEADRSLGKLEDQAADRQIADLGLEQGLVTSQTSLVAVDETPVRPTGAMLTREELPMNLPAGWDFDTLFGGEAAKAAAANAGTMGERAAQQATAAEALDLPQTATGFLGTLAGGVALLLSGLAGLVLLRRHGSVA